MSTSYSGMAIGSSGIAAARSRAETGGYVRTKSEGTSVVVLANGSGDWLQALIPAARAGDEQAFQGLVEAYRSPAERLARSILLTEEAAADAVQEALIKVYRAMPRFKDGNFRAWLLRIVSNTCYDHLRSQKRRKSISLEQMIEELDYEAPDCGSEQNPERYALRREKILFLSRMVERLPSWYREVVVLVDIHGYDYGEAAAFLDLPRGTVKSRLSRARANLRDQLADAGMLL